MQKLTIVLFVCLLMVAVSVTDLTEANDVNVVKQDANAFLKRSENKRVRRNNEEEEIDEREEDAECPNAYASEEEEDNREEDLEDYWDDYWGG